MRCPPETGELREVARGKQAAEVGQLRIADVDEDGVVDFNDLILVLAAWGVCPACPEDLNEDGVVDFADVLLVLSAWGVCP